MIALIICAAFVPIVESAAPWRLIDSALFALMLFGLLYEIVADLQPTASLKQQSAPGQQDTRLMRTGSWSLSRHPNYFGDSVFLVRHQPARLKHRELAWVGNYRTR